MLQNPSRIENFDFAKPEEWPRWLRHFERFRQASGLATKTQEVQVSTLIYSMGDKAEDLLESFNLTDKDAKDYSKEKSKFQGYFDKRRNTIYERARFNTRKQEDNKTVDEFIADLHRLAKHCVYETLCDKLIRDHIVVGIKDREVSEKLQMKGETDPRRCHDDDEAERGSQDSAASSEGGACEKRSSFGSHKGAKQVWTCIYTAPGDHKVSTQTTEVYQVWKVAAPWSPAVPS